MTKKIKLPEKEIIEMYLNYNLSSVQIAKKFNCDTSVILDRLKKNNIQLRPNGFFNLGKVPPNKGKRTGISWNRGLTKETDERVKKGIEKGKVTRRGKHYSPKTEFKKGMVSPKKNKSFEEMYGEERAKELKENLRKANIGKHPTKETIQKVISALRERYVIRGIPSKIKNKTFEELYTKEKAERIREDIRKARAKQIFPKNNSYIELRVQNLLTQLHLEYYTHKYMNIKHGYLCDILIPKQIRVFSNGEIIEIKQPIICEVDGCYWHGCLICNKVINKWQKDQIEEDNLRTSELIKKGFRVIRLKEHEIKTMELNNLKDRING